MLLAASCASDLQSLPIHPAFGLDLCEPVLSRWNSSQIFPNVLFSDVPHWDFFPLTVVDRDTEDFFTKENTFCMMTKGAVTEVRGRPSTHQTNHELAGSLRACRRISSRYSVHASSGVPRSEFPGLVIYVREVPAVFVDNFAFNWIDDDRARTSVPVSPTAMFGIQKLVG